MTTRGTKTKTNSEHGQRDASANGDRNEQQVRDELVSIGAEYRKELLEDTVPFWMNHAIDTEHGGYLFCLDRTGNVVDTDKPVWLTGRFVWLLATLYRTITQNSSWIETAAAGLSFLREHAFDDDGRMYFLLDRSGRPLRKRRYLFSECFGALALAAYGRATGDDRALSEADTLADIIQEMLLTKTSERQGRLIDTDSAGSMEKKKIEGYF